MIEALLPPGAVAVEARTDRPDAVALPGEETVVARAVESRRREFATGRACARAALERLGLQAGPIGSGDDGEPLWPAGIVGSITHCTGYRAAAVAFVERVPSLGIDAEPNRTLPEGLLADIALPAERDQLPRLAREAPEVHWDRLLFSAKESVYKTWFPLARRWLGFEDASVELHPGGTFTARLLVPGPNVAGAPLRELDGGWIAAGGLVATAIALTP